MINPHFALIMDISLILQENYIYLLFFGLVLLLFKNRFLSRIYKLQFVNAQDAHSASRQSSKPLFLDIRTSWEIAQSPRIKASKAIPLSELKQRLDEIQSHKEGKQVIVVCRSGGRAISAGIQLKKMGFTEVSVLKGGIAAWLRAGYPVTRPKKKVKQTYG